MKILVAHNYYGSSAPSGENIVVAAEKNLLRSAGHEVIEYRRDSDVLRRSGLIGKLRGALMVPWNHSAYMDVKKQVKRFKPDIVHVHNTFPMLSPAIFHALKDVAVVSTIHNYRMFCASALLQRSGNVCTECLDNKSSIAAIRHGCYRQSRIATLPISLSIGLHRRLDTWSKYVDGVIVLSEFQKTLLCEAGLSRSRVHVKPNFVESSGRILDWEARKNRVVVVGRVSEEKGVGCIVDAWLKWGEAAPELLVVGGGELLESLKAKAQQNPNVKIEFTGLVTSAIAKKYIAESKLLVMPSTWYETFGLSVVEAFSMGTPVAASDIGPLHDLLEGGKLGGLFEPGDPDSLLNCVRDMWCDTQRLKSFAGLARAKYEGFYSPQKNVDLLQDIYAKAMNCRGS